MDKLDRLVGVITAVFGTTLSFAFGEWNESIKILMLLIVLDWITGTIKAFSSGDLESKTARSMMFKKFVGLDSGMLIAIILSNLTDKLTPGDTPAFRTITIFFYIGVELNSLVENLALMGVKLPPALIKGLKQITESAEASNVNEKKEVEEK